jgi:hypothetical protein
LATEASYPHCIPFHPWEASLLRSLLVGCDPSEIYHNSMKILPPLAKALAFSLARYAFLGGSVSGSSPRGLQADREAVVWLGDPAPEFQAGERRYSDLMAKKEHSYPHKANDSLNSFRKTHGGSEFFRFCTFPP